MSSISNYNKISHDGKHYKTEFTLSKTPVYIANSLRRSFSSMVPTVTFDDTYFDDINSRSIRIHKNTSALHNEFLSHRISLTPINCENTNLLTETVFNKDGTRSFQFARGNDKLIFRLNKKNNQAMSQFRDKLGLINVKTSDFEIENYNGEILPTDDFFKPDVFTNDHILLDKLKQDLGNEDGGEEIIIDCVPQINMGRFSTKNDPTGTVTYEMVVDDSRVDSVFEQKKLYLNTERVKKGLPEFSDDEVTQLRTSFDLLDKDRVIQTDQNGNPNIFKISVESIGFLNPDLIINDGLGMLIISLKDIQNSFTFDPQTYKFTNNNKIEMNLIDSTNVNTGWIIKVINENHTVGNLLSNVIRNIWCDEGTFLDYPALKMAAYKMHHPTIEEIEFMLIPKEMSKSNKIEIINKLYNLDVPIIGQRENHLDTEDEDSVNKLLCALVFQKSINCCIEMLLDIKKTENLRSLQLNFNVKDDDEWMLKNTHISGYFNNDSIPLSNIYNIKSILNIDKQVEVVPAEVTSHGYSPEEPLTPPYSSVSPQSPTLQTVDTPPYISASTPPVAPQEQESPAEEESRKQAEGDSETESVSSPGVKESIIPGITQDIFTYNMSELLEGSVKNKKRFDTIIQKLYSIEDAEKLEVSVTDFDSIVEMIKSPDSATNKVPIKGDKLDVNFTKKAHDTDSNKSIYKGIRVDYSKKTIALFTKTITLKKK
tara:strand:+ start:571 stop:2700 length:2130 start_codon:yes stop_codon:yes gene_type:complete